MGSPLGSPSHPCHQIDMGVRPREQKGLAQTSQGCPRPLGFPAWTGERVLVLPTIDQSQQALTPFLAWVRAKVLLWDPSHPNYTPAQPVTISDSPFPGPPPVPGSKAASAGSSLQPWVIAGREVRKQSKPRALPPLASCVLAHPSHESPVPPEVTPPIKDPPGRRAPPPWVSGTGVGTDCQSRQALPETPRNLPRRSASCSPFSSTYRRGFWRLRQHFLQVLLKPLEQPGPRPAEGPVVSRAA